MVPYRNLYASMCVGYSRSKMSFRPLQFDSPRLRVVRDNLVPIVLAAVGILLLVDLGRSLLSGGTSVSQFMTFLWDGVGIGLILGLAGIGLTLTYSILGFANVSHGDVLTAGAFAGWSAAFVTAGLGRFHIESLVLLGPTRDLYASDLGISLLNTPLTIFAGIVVAAIFTIALSLGFDRTVYAPLRGATRSGGIMLLIASIGVAFFTRYLVVLVYTPTTRAVAVSPQTLLNFGISRGGLAVARTEEALTAGVPLFSIPLGLGGPPEVLLNIDSHEALLVFGAAALMLGIHLLLKRTMLGKAMRAMADNKELARARGIPTERVTRWTWIIGSGITGAAGFLIALERGTIGFLLGWDLLLLIFAAVILGGIGSVYGAILGGLIIGITSTVSLVWLPEATLSRPLAFLIMIVVLIVKPRGLFGGREVG